MPNVLQPYVDRGELAGAVTLVADAKKVLQVECVGYADLAARRPMRPDTMFWIASMTKPFTGTAVTMLIDEGKLTLDDPVEKFLPEFKNLRAVAYKDDTHVLLKRPLRPITLREVLSHTSGMPFGSVIEEGTTRDVLALRDYVVSYAMTPLECDPGTKYIYSNAGIAVAARVLEVVAGVPYADFVRTRILEPLGLTNTAFVPTPQQEARVAKAYQPNADKNGLADTPIYCLKYPLSDPSRTSMPGGGLFSTAGDCARFMQMVLNEGTLDGRRYLSPEAVKLMTSKQTPSALTDPYGLGWAAEEHAFGHGGAFCTNMTADRKMGMIAVYMIQACNGFLGEGATAYETFMKDAKGMFVATP